MDCANYAAVAAIANERGLPLRFKGDLEIDRRVMNESPEREWVWVLYEDGTHLWTLDPCVLSTPTSCTFGKWVRAVRLNSERPMFFFVGGGKARPLTAEELAREHWSEGSSAA